MIYINNNIEGAEIRVAEPQSRKPPVPAKRTILRHCRCMDCRKFGRDAVGAYICKDNIGGESVVWATGKHVCDPPPDDWHYCAGYDGPAISKDVWVWTKTMSS